MNGDVKILIGVSTTEMARRADFYDFLGSIMRPEGTHVSTVHGQSPAAARNVVIQEALEGNYTHILFLDDDVKPMPNLLMNLLNADKDMVTGFYLMRSFPHQPILFDTAYEDGSCRHMFPVGSGLIEIVACGLGAILIKTDVFRTMDTEDNKQHGKSQWVRLGECDRDNWCDDIGFFNRARGFGYKIYCDLNSTVGHDFSGTVYPELKNGEWHVIYASNGTGTISIPAQVPEWALQLRKEAA